MDYKHRKPQDVSLMLRDNEIHNSFAAAFVQNCHTSGDIPNISGTVSLIGTGQAALAFSVMYDISQRSKIALAVISLDMLDVLQEQVLA